MNTPLAESYRFCDLLSRREAKNFYYSFRLLPTERRKSMTALYAFLRKTDDIADDPGAAIDKRVSLDAWRMALDLALKGENDSFWPGLPALADTVHRHAIPPKYLIEVIDGVKMDLEGFSYSTFDDLYRYCYRVASAVGLSCLYIWGFDETDGEAQRLAEANGLALQLTNILRDVRADAVIGRTYLPAEDLERFKVRPESLRNGVMTPPHRDLFVFQADRARRYYDLAAPLAGWVNPVGRPVLATITGIYRALLDEIVRQDYDVLKKRIRIPAWRKATITCLAWLRRSTPAPERESSRC